ncbi:unnamed protein product [Adineta ricciae]|uniref:Uncharacterized protein n=1 Tax=Adineta ricciae TaxID=249248 RepID=A0A814QR91_ADIRI|nr:unnamed protein product [Adineta ricciae]
MCSRLLLSSRQCRRILIGVIIICIILFLYAFANRINNSQAFILTYYSLTNENHNDINLGFSDFYIEEEKLREKQLEYEYDLTCTIIHWNRSNGVRKTVEFALRTRLFKEILVWNNNPNVKLSISDFDASNRSTKIIRIRNSKANLKDEAKYRACAEAKTRACFYVDDDWDISHYTKSLIASYRSDPNVLHSVTEPYTYYTNLIWSYFDTDIDLHAGFSWIGCGSIFLREHAQRHVELLHQFLSNQTDLIQLGDVFFSIWLNDIPIQMNTEVVQQTFPSADKSIPFSSTPNFLALQYRSSVIAIRILEHSLRSARLNNRSIPFPRQRKGRFPYYVKSPSPVDDFIFYSNILPYDLHNTTFNITRDFERGTRKNLPHGSQVQYFTSHSTLMAIDGDPTTCWHSTRTIRSNDFYAIDFLYIQTNITFLLHVNHRTMLQKDLDVSISTNGLWWISYRSYNGIYTKMTNHRSGQQVYTILFSASQFNPGFRSFRYIKFQTSAESNDRFQTSIEVVVSVAYKLSNNNLYMAQLERWKTFGKNIFVVCIRSSHRLTVRCTTKALLNDLKMSTATHHKGTNTLKHACAVSMENNLYLVRLLSSDSHHHHQTINAKLQNLLDQYQDHSHINLSGEDLTDDDMKTIVDEIIVKKQCKQLLLESNRITSSGLAILAQGLHKNQSLNYLDLSHNQISDAGLSALADSLTTGSQVLKKLGLAKNEITDHGMKYLAELIKTNRTLTQLDLCSNQISDDGIRLLADAVRHHGSTIEILWLMNNPLITDDSVDSMIQMIKHSQSLRQLWIFKCSLSELGKEKLKRLEQTKDIVEHGADVHMNKDTFGTNLRQGVHRVQLDMTYFLVGERKYNVNLVNFLLGRGAENFPSTSDCVSPLLLAAEERFGDIVKAIVLYCPLLVVKLENVTFNGH